MAESGTAAPQKAGGKSGQVPINPTQSVARGRYGPESGRMFRSGFRRVPEYI
jgi:hypothetical protein